jgi:glycosyltransferase involved in cell wall biosynthesis
MTICLSGRPLRVTFVIDDLFIGGAERGLAEEVCAFDPDRIRSHVISLANADVASLVPEVQAQGVNVTYVTGAGLTDMNRLLKLARVIRRTRPDVVQTSLDYANVLGVLAARMAGRPVVASLRNVSTHQSRADYLKRYVQRLVLRWGAQRVTLVAATARAEAAHYFGLPIDQIVPLPNAIDLRRLEPALRVDRAAKRGELGIPTDAPLVCSVARLDPVKGHRFLLDAVSQLGPCHSRGHYVFAGIGSHGDRDEEARLIAQAERLGLAHRIHFVGERSDVLEIVAASDLFVLPSLMEGLSRALLESMGLGVPVIATNVGGNPDVLTDGETGWSIEPSDPVALRNALEEALSRPDLAAERAARAQALIVERFSMQAHLAQLETLYREVALAG